MGEMLEVEVKVISEEVVKPSSSIPSHLKTFSLSLMDQTYTAMHHMSMILCYPATTTSLPLDIASLSTSLSKTLAQFYPFAGRCIDHSTIDYNDEGIPLIITRVLNCPRVSDVIISHQKLKTLDTFLPPTKFKAQLGCRPMSEQVPMAFQINVFECGGFVIGCYFLHKLLDAMSFGTFLNYWASLSSKCYEDVTSPNFEVTVQAFPPSPTGPPARAPKPWTSFSNPKELVCRTFPFSRTAINNIKASAVSDVYPSPTSFEALAGFIWKQANLAAGDLIESGIIGLSMATSMRARAVPPLPKESTGNLVMFVQARANKEASLAEIVAKIHVALGDKVEAKIKALKEHKAPSEYMAECRGEHSRDAVAGKAGFYTLTSLCRIYQDADFGIGKPKGILDCTLHTSMRRNYILFTDYIDANGENGFLVLLVLEENEMHILESNPEFLAFTTPS